MRDTYRNWVAAGLLKDGKSKGGLARAMGLHQSQVTRLLDGHRQIKAEEVPLIAKYLGENPPGSGGPFDLPDVAESASERSVRVVGYVGAGAKAHYYALPPDELDTVPAPENASPQTVAVEIRGSSLGPMFDRWIAFYDDVRRPATDDLIGKLCVIGLSDERVLIKRLERGRRAGLFRLASNTEPPIEDVPIEWAARVNGMVPR